MDPSEIAEEVTRLVPQYALVVFSGGEPLLQPEGISQTIRLLVHDGFDDFAVETAGTRMPLLDDVSVHYTVSPKLNNSGNDKDKRYKPEVLTTFRDLEADFKFVVQHPSDLVEIQDIVYEVGIQHDRIWVMPQGIEARETILTSREIASHVLDRGWNFTFRDHVLLYGNERGH
jgi:organic radical activating enzyme